MPKIFIYTTDITFHHSYRSETKQKKIKRKSEELFTFFDDEKKRCARKILKNKNIFKKVNKVGGEDKRNLWFHILSSEFFAKDENVTFVQTPLAKSLVEN